METLRSIDVLWSDAGRLSWLVISYIGAAVEISSFDARKMADIDTMLRVERILIAEVIL
jgi:hypothetical protein